MSQLSIEKLQELLKKGRMSNEAKVEVRKLISALKKGNQKTILDISWNLHQNIGGMSMDYPLREDHDYNTKVTGTTVYQEADKIAHGDY